LLKELETNQNILVVKNSTNLGFSKAVNRGIAALNEGSKDIESFLVLNQDSSLMDDHIHTALDLMDENPRVGLCGPRLHNGDGTVQNSFYAYPSPAKKMAQLVGLKKLGSLIRKVDLSPRLFFFPSFASYYLWNYQKFTQPIEVPWITGACLLIRKTAFESLSGFDENIWMYAEDMDLCLRARQMDWSVVFCPDWHVLHQGGKSSDMLSPELLRVFYDSLSYFYSKHFYGVKKKCMLFLNQLEETKALRSASKASRKGT